MPDMVFMNDAKRALLSRALSAHDGSIGKLRRHLEAKMNPDVPKTIDDLIKIPSESKS